IGLNDKDIIGLALFVSYQVPTGFDDYRFFTFGSSPDLSLPFTRLFKLCSNLIERLSIAAKEYVGDALPQHVFKRPAVYALGTFVPIQDVVFKIADEDRVLSFVQQRGLLTNSLFGEFPLGNIETNRDILKRLTALVEKGHYRRIDPIDRTVFRSVAK